MWKNFIQYLTTYDCSYKFTNNYCQRNNNKYCKCVTQILKVEVLFFLKKTMSKEVSHLDLIGVIAPQWQCSHCSIHPAMLWSQLSRYLRLKCLIKDWKSCESVNHLFVTLLLNWCANMSTFGVELGKYYFVRPPAILRESSFIKSPVTDALCETNL